MEQFKNNIAGILAIIALLTAIFTFDTRYAHSEDVKRENVQTQELIQQTTNNLRRVMIEDKIFEIDIKQSQQVKPTIVDVALKARYLRQLAEIPKEDTK